MKGIRLMLGSLLLTPALAMPAVSQGGAARRESRAAARERRRARRGHGGGRLLAYGGERVAEPARSAGETLPFPGESLLPVGRPVRDKAVLCRMNLGLALQEAGTQAPSIVSLLMGVKVVPLLLTLAVWAATGCETFEEGATSAAQQTQPARERVSEDTDEIAKRLQQRVDELFKEVDSLEQKEGGADATGQR